MNTEKAIDLNYLEETFDGNQAIINEILKSFMKNTPRLTTELITQLGSDKWYDAKMIAHKIKNSYYTVGANKVGVVLEKIETGSNKSGIVNMKPLVLELTKRSKAVFKEVSLILKKHG